MSKKTCPKNCWCDCHDKNTVGITDKMRLDYILRRGKLTPIHIGWGPKKKFLSWGYRIVFPLLEYGLPKSAIDAAIRAERRRNRE